MNAIILILILFAVGFGLYCQILKRTVARLRGENPPQLVDVTLVLDFIDAPAGDIIKGAASAASIPSSFIDDETARMSMYRRLAEASEIPETRALAVEMEDRFGAIPDETRRLLRIAELRISAAHKGIRRIEVKDGVVRPSDIHGRPITGPGGRFPRLKGDTVDAKLTSLFRAVSRM